jgi:eukaryotic-like serine/threonine-protein kinase
VSPGFETRNEDMIEGSHASPDESTHVTASDAADDVPARLRSALGGRYEIERELGRGGMATVYLARDLRHERRVALKALNPALGVALSAERFLREIRVTASLTHPHILPLHDSGEAGGLLYYVMPYVEGETLRDRLARGPMAAELVVRLMRDVASALAYAHRQGVVHRDIKPANILLADDHAVIADFGIARAVRRAREQGPDGNERGALATLTDVGTSLGTPAYMAPEQAVGDSAVDHRADLYALGVVAYEAIAGVHPFGSRVGHAMIAAHLSETPPPLHSRRPDLPAGLTTVVMQCLDKDPSSRPQSAEEIVAALDAMPPGPGSTSRSTHGLTRRWKPAAAIGATVVLLAIGAAVALTARRTGRGAEPARNGSASTAGAMRSLAVIPFENTDRVAADEYFSDGLTDELAHVLASLPGLRIAGRTSSYAFKHKAVPAQEIGRTLDVGAIIVGTVRRAGERLRVTTQLVNTGDGKVVLDRVFESRSGDVFAVQDELTRAIVAAIGPALGGQATTSAAPSTRGTTDAEAYDLYLKGRYYWLERGAANVAQSIALFRQAIARDSGFARAYAGLSMSYNVLSVYVADPTDSATALVEASAKRAIALDSTLADSHVALAMALDRRLRFDEAAASYRKAITMEPSNAYAHHALGFNLINTGKTDQAIAELRLATRLDPLAKSAGTALAAALVAARRFPEALAESRRVLAIDSTFALGLHVLGFVQMFAGHPDSAVLTLERVAQSHPDSPGASSFLLFAYAAAGRWANAEQLRERLHRPGGDQSGGAEAAFADLVFGDREPAVRLVMTDAGMRNWLGSFIGLGCIPLIDPLWSDARFRARMRAKNIETCSLAGPWPLPPRPRG